MKTLQNDFLSAAGVTDNADDWYDQHIEAWLDYQRTVSDTQPDAQHAQ